MGSPLDRSESGPTLYSGEALSSSNGAPTLTYFQRGYPHRPLCVLIPGAAHLARVFYGGHRGHDSKDFLAHWLVGSTLNPSIRESNPESSSDFGPSGYNVLAISYPLESSPAIMPPTRPDFTVREWGEQAAEVTERVMMQERLSRDAGIILLVWSMAGKVIAPFTSAARERGLDVRFVVSLAATPALRGLKRKPPPPTFSNAGYVHGGYVSNEYFLKQLHEQRVINSGDSDRDRFINPLRDENCRAVSKDNANVGNFIVPDDVFIREYTGNFPVGLAAWGWRWSPEEQAPDVATGKKKGKLVDDPNAGFEVTDETMIEDLPPMCALYGDSPADLRHSAGDKSMWAFLIIQNLLGRIRAKELRSLTHDQERGKKVMRLIREAPERLSAEVEGGHHFFLGRKGAKRSAEWIVEFEKRVEQLKTQMSLGLARKD